MADSFLIILISGILLALFLGILIGFLIRKKSTESRVESIEAHCRKIVEEAQKEAETVKKEATLQAKDSLYQMKMEFEKETKDRKQEIQDQEKRILNKEQNPDRKIEVLKRRDSEFEKKERLLTQKEKDIVELKEKYEILISEQKKQLEYRAGISSQEAKELLLLAMENEAKHEAAKTIRRLESEAKEIISLAIKRYAGDYVAEKTVSYVNLPNEEMKGRIIGREGRNIRAIEAATGIDLIIDDTPEAVILSGFNSVRREVARLSLERLISDGRIHPARIEEVVKKVSQEMEVAIREAGEAATFDVGVHGIHPEMIKLVGKLKYRSSYGQNVLQHSLEVAFLCGVMAAELGLNIKQAKRAGLLHDIGKAVDHEVEGTHAAIGADLAKRYGESNRVIHAVASHHEDIPLESILDVLVQAADTLSGARPGARKEMLETYVKRLEDLEKIAQSFEGIGKTYALQAGREIRIMVESEKVTDNDIYVLSRDIAKKIEECLTYPGQIKVTVIREIRAVEYAK